MRHNSNNRDNVIISLQPLRDRCHCPMEVVVDGGYWLLHALVMAASGWRAATLQKTPVLSRPACVAPSGGANAVMQVARIRGAIKSGRIMII
eukprot:scaffold20809_cov144-Skeletonema_dohrnii-CCMP3373.AAC.1